MCPFFYSLASCVMLLLFSAETHKVSSPFFVDCCPLDITRNSQYKNFKKRENNNHSAEKLSNFQAKRKELGHRKCIFHGKGVISTMMKDAKKNVCAVATLGEGVAKLVSGSWMTCNWVKINHKGKVSLIVCPTFKCLIFWRRGKRCYYGNNGDLLKQTSPLLLFWKMAPRSKV